MYSSSERSFSKPSIILHGKKNDAGSFARRVSCNCILQLPENVYSSSQKGVFLVSVNPTSYLVLQMINRPQTAVYISRIVLALEKLFALLSLGIFGFLFFIYRFSLPEASSSLLAFFNFSN